MNQESRGDTHPSPYILLPEGPIIRERLEHISDDSSFRSGVIPKIMQLAEISFEPAELVESVEAKLSEFAEEKLLGIKVLAMKDMPEIIMCLVDDDTSRRVALEAWQGIEAERAEQADVKEAELRRAHRGYNQPKFPRRRKKQITKKNRR
jgi:hypothetical protein